MDSSAETIKKANNLKEGGEITYNVHIEGDISKECVGRVNPDIVSTHCRMDVTSAGQEIYLFILFIIRTGVGRLLLLGMLATYRPIWDNLE